MKWLKNLFKPKKQYHEIVKILMPLSPELLIDETEEKYVLEQFQILLHRTRNNLKSKVKTVIIND